jgi:hypothetical protein
MYEKFFGFLYLVCTATMFLVLGLLVSDWTESTDYQLDYKTGFMNQVYDDWHTAPFYKIEVNDTTSCPQGSE